MFVRFIHLRTGRPTYIDVFAVTSVRQNPQGDTLVFTGDRGQYVAEPIDLVVDTIMSIRQANQGQMDYPTIGLESGDPHEES